jgi:hypothetical protein
MRNKRKFLTFQVLQRKSIQNLVNKIRTGILRYRKLKHHHRALTEEKLDKIRAELEHSPVNILNALQKKWEYQKGPQELL